MEMSSDTEKKLNSLQRWFVRLILQVGPGAPVASLLWDFGLLDMGLRVWIEKVMLALHVRRLEEDTLARKMYEEQQTCGWPGLAQEAETICQELKIESVNVTGMGKKAYRNLVTRACYQKNEERLKSQSEGKLKCTKIEEEIFEKKEYVKEEKIDKVRKTFRTRFGMLPFAGNYGHDRRFAQTNWLCRCLKTREEEAHLLSGQCEIYGPILEKYDNMDNDENLVNFFSEVLAMREKLEDEEKV